MADGKILFDAVNLEQAQGDDARSALGVAIIQESMAELGGRTGWVQHTFNPADALTKLDGVHLEPLMRLLSTNTFRVKPENGILAQGKRSGNRKQSQM